MNKIKKIWVENRVLFVLFIIVLVCMLIIAGVCMKYFFGSSKSSYGDRLDGIEEVAITEDIKNHFLSSMQNDELIENVTIKNIGRVVYISLHFKSGTSLEEAKNKALASLMAFEQKYLDYYDFHYTLKGNTLEAGDFLIMGAKNAKGNGLNWTNNTEVVKNEE